MKKNRSKDNLLKYNSLIHSIEEQTGIDINTIMNTTLSDQKIQLENKFKKPMKLISYFPFIGRGNVLRDKVITHEDIEKMLDSIFVK
jgi:hypothetical protein